MTGRPGASRPAGGTLGGDTSGGRPIEIRHDVATTIQRPLDDVARYVFDPRTMPEWSAILYAVEDPDEQSLLARGRRLSANLQLFGVDVTVDGELLDLDLQARRGTVRLRFRDSTGSIDHRLELEAVDEVTVLHLRNRVLPPPWLADHVDETVVRRYVEHTAEFAMANIKTILEAHQEDAVALARRRAAEELPAPADLGQPLRRV